MHGARRRLDPRAVWVGDIDQAAEAVEAALSIGVTVFDHADIYRHGKAEQVFGEVLRRSPGLRERIEIQTKCGIRLEKDRAPYDLDRASIVERVDASLARLGVDYVDTLLLHRPDPLLEPAEVALALGELHAAGKIRGFGVSNMSAAQMAFLQREVELPITVNQLEMSLLRRDWVDSTVLVNHAEQNGFPHGTLEYCASNGVRLQAWGALARGTYSGAATRTVAEGEASALVATLAAEKNTTREAIVLGWLMRHPARIDPVLGSSDPGRIRACADAEAQASAMTRNEWFALYLAARGGPLP